MRYILALAAGIVVLLASGYAYANDRMAASAYGNDKVITNDDPQESVPGSDNSTFNQMPTTQDSNGSAAGGMSKGPDSMQQESDQGAGPADKTPMKPPKEPDSGDTGGEPYTPGY